MLCYKDRTFCSASDCQTLDCHRNTKNLDPEHVKMVNLPLAFGDFFRECPEYMKGDKDYDKHD